MDNTREKRLIDANALCEKLEHTSADVCQEFWEGFSKFGFSKILLNLILSELPTVDAVEVVRCKDCKHLKYGYQCYYPLGMMLNNDGDAYVLVDPDDDFCSHGERKTEE